MRQCRFCGKTYPMGASCNCKQSRTHYREYDRNHRTKETKSYNFYKSSLWIKMREHIRRKYMGCDLLKFGETGLLVPASNMIVHHIIPYKEDEAFALEESNLVLLSHQSHEYVEAEYKKSPTAKKHMQNLLKLYQLKWDEYINSL